MVPRLARFKPLTHLGLSSQEDTMNWFKKKYDGIILLKKIE